MSSSNLKDTFIEDLSSKNGDDTERSESDRSNSSIDSKNGSIENEQMKSLDMYRKKSQNKSGGLGLGLGLGLSSSVAATSLENVKSRSIAGVRKRNMPNSSRSKRSKSINRKSSDFIVEIDKDTVGNLPKIPSAKAPSHHRRTSFFNTFHSESRANSETIPAANPYDFDGLAEALNEHISTTQAQLQCSPYTLSFIDDVDEAFYTEFTVALQLRTWLWMGVIGIFAIGAMQALMAFTLPQVPSMNELYLIIMVYVPLGAIVSFAYLANDVIVSKYLPLLSFFYVLISGPVFIIGRALLIQTQSTIFALSPIYITILYCSTYFFELRYIYSVAIALISLAGWFTLAIASWNWELGSPTMANNSFEQKAYFIWSGVAVVLAMFFMCALTYTTEWNNRLQFLSNQQLIIFNSKLQKQLKGLEHTYCSKIADLESPLEKAITSIKLLLASPQISGSQIRILHEILVCLNSSHLMAPDLYHQVTSGEVVMDKEEEKWLFNELVRSQKESISFVPEIDSQEQTQIISTRSADNSSVTSTSEKSLSKEYIPIEILLTDEVREMLRQVQVYNFPIFKFTEATQNRPLVVMAHTLIIQSGLAQRLQLPIQKLMNFLFSVENGYRSELPFHNSIHAADVLHGIFHLCQLDKIRGTFSDLETLSIYIAASIHDFDHPGVNNNFLIATRDKKALLYNDKSVLENHHCSAAFNLLLKPEHNIFEGLDRKTFSTVRSNIVDIVLATDLAQHFDLLTRFKKKVVTAGTFDPFGSPDDKSILMQMLMKCSDVSNPTKEWPIYQEWINRILQEFYNQGDLEKKLGLPISPFMNRDSPGPSAQKGFIEYIVYPLFEALESWTEISEIKRNLNGSRDLFCNPNSTTTSETSSSGSLKKQRKPLRALRTDIISGQEVGAQSAIEHTALKKFKRYVDVRRSSLASSLFNQTRAHSTILSSVLGVSEPVTLIQEDAESQLTGYSEEINEREIQSQDENPFSNLKSK